MNEVVHQVSCGGSIMVPIIQVSNLSQAVSELKDKGVWFVATSEGARTHTRYSTIEAYVSLWDLKVRDSNKSY